MAKPAKRHSMVAFAWAAVASCLLAQQPGERLLNLNTERPIPLAGLINDLVQNTGEKIIFSQQDIQNISVTIRTAEPLTVSSLLPIVEQALRENQLVLVEAKIPGWKTIVRESDLPPEERKRRDIATEFVVVENVDAGEIASQLTQILEAQAKAFGSTEPQGGPPQTQQPQVSVTQDGRTNRLLLIGEQEEITRAKAIIKQLDVSLNLVTRPYAFRNVPAERIDKLIKDLLPELYTKQRYRSAIDPTDNLLIATTTEDVHEQLRELQKARDVPQPRTKSPMQFYKVKNLPVTEVLQTIRSIEQQSSRSNFDPLGVRELGSDGRIRPASFGSNDVVSGPNRLPGAPGQLPLPPSYTELPDGGEGGELAVPQGAGSMGPVVVAPGPSAPQESGNVADLLGKARISADVHTNTLIVVAEPAAQRLYSDLIEQLDKRRPQVLIEAQFVVLDVTDDFSLGIEFSAGDRSGSRRSLAFSSFGLSNVDPATGALSLIPGLGFNGTIVDPDVADVVLRALTTHDRSRVTSSPRVVVNDNATGQLTSVSEVPFTSVNASQTVATTSFAGFAEAGTTITVTPRISDDDYLQLDFTITQNTFTGTGADGVPPPRQTDEVTSQVTIPDGHTVIVGGLKRTSQGNDYSGFPIIDRIPVLRMLGGNQTRSSNRSSLFVFLKPIILRDDKFKELKYLSERDARCAGICPDFPTSEPVIIR